MAASFREVVLFFIRIFFHDYSRIIGLQGKGKDISLTPLYHFHPLHRHLDISQAVTTESSPLNIASNRTRIGNFALLCRKLNLNLQALEKSDHCKWPSEIMIILLEMYHCKYSSKITIHLKQNYLSNTLYIHVASWRAYTHGQL